MFFKVPVNAVYHRGYDQREPIEVRINPDRIEIVSYPGPDASIRMEALRDGRFVSRRYRNRRIGEFLKELEMTEGRSAGIPVIHDAMAKNGSPPPRFETDKGRAYFLVELPIHPLFVPVVVPVAQEGVQDIGEVERRILVELKESAKMTVGLLESLGYSGRSRNLRNALLRMQKSGLIELTVPDKPNSKNQKRRLTKRGRQWITENGNI